MYISLSLYIYIYMYTYTLLHSIYLLYIITNIVIVATIISYSIMQCTTNTWHIY